MLISCMRNVIHFGIDAGILLSTTQITNSGRLQIIICFAQAKLKQMPLQKGLNLTVAKIASVLMQAQRILVYHIPD